MKKRLLFIFGIIACWTATFGQVPEYLYYKFNDSTGITNYASNPQGNQNIPIPPNLFIDTIGFQNSNSLSGSGDSAIGGIHTGFFPDYSHSFTISFWYQDTSQISGSGFKARYLFGDSLANFHCYIQKGAFFSLVVIYGGVIKGQYPGFLTPGQPNIITVSYNSTATINNPYGIFSLYINGSLSGTVKVRYQDIAKNSSGLILGSPPGYTPNVPGINLDVDMAGNLDEFRWYDRALSPTEIQNTYNHDLLAKGSCNTFTNFTIDSISGDAARISWAPGSNSGSFQLEYDTTGFMPGTGNIISGTYPGSQPPIILNALNPEKEYDVYFKEYCNGSSDSIYNPNPQTFTTTPFCPTPSNIKLSATQDSIELNWDHNGPLQNYYITYGPEGFDTTSSGITDTISALPYKVGGLSPETVYDFYVQTACGGVYGKSIAVKRSTMTDCGIKAAPYITNFEDSTWGAPPYPNSPVASDTLNPCWTRIEDNSTFNWEIMKGNLANMQNNHFLGTDGMYPSSISASYGQEAYIYSPVISLDNLTHPYLSFDLYRQFAKFQDYDLFKRIQPDLYVEINDGNGWQILKKFSGSEQTNDTVHQLLSHFNITYPTPESFNRIGIDLSTFNDTVQFRFRAVNLTDIGQQSGITAIDNFSVDEAPSCPYVSGISTISYGIDTSIVLNIDADTSSFTMEWGPKGFSQGTGCFATKSQPYTLSTCISLNQEMDLYLQDCNGGWQGPFSFCGPYAAPYSNSFDQYIPDVLQPMPLRTPQCWQMYATGMQSAGDLVDIFPDAPNYDAQRNNKLELYNYSVTSGDTLMAITPAFIDLPQGDKQIRFKALVFDGNSVSQGNTLEIGTISNPKDGSTFHPIQTIQLKYHNWKEYIVSFDPSNSSYNGTDMYIALKAGPGIKITQVDDFYYEQIPSCQAPYATSLKADSISFDGARISWSSISNSPSIIAYGPQGFDPNIGGQQATALTDTFYNLNGLNSATFYDVYIRDSCGANDYSSWTGPISFMTYCTPFTAPFSEDFDGPSWISAPPQDPYAPAFGNHSNIHDTLDPCWRRNVRSGTKRYSQNIDSLYLPYQEYYHTWGITANYTGGLGNSGPLTDHSGSGNYAFSIPRRSASLAGKKEDIGDLYSPFIDISALNHPYLSFFYHRYGDPQMPDFWIEVNDGTGWDTLQYYSGPDPTQTSRTSPYNEAGIDLSGFQDTIQLRFRSLYQYPSTTGQYVPKGLTAIDDIEVKEAPPCITPGNLSANYHIKTSIGSWSTTVRWDSSASLVIGYQVVIGDPGFNADSLAGLGLAYTLGNIDSLIVDTLIPGKCYEFAVRSLCTSGDTSGFSNHYAFCLPCIEQAPVVENFDLFNTIERYDPALIPSTYPCWHYTSFTPGGVNSGFKWDVHSSDSSFLGLLDASGYGKYVYANSDNGNANDSAYFYSPVVDIQNTTKPQISFAYHMHGVNVGTLHLDLFDGDQWHKDVVQLSGPQQSSANDPWKDTIISLNSYNTTGFIQARFWCKYIGFNGTVALDNIWITDTLTCPFPQAFTMSSHTDSNATLSWTSDTNSQSFIVEYGLKGFSYGQGTQLISNGDSVIIPVNDNRIYEAYLTSQCGAGDTSLLVGPIQFYSKVDPCDDMEAYQPGQVNGQSTLIKGWDDNAYIGNPNYNFITSGGDAIFDTSNAVSGIQSLRVYDGGASGYSDVAAVFPPISTGIYDVQFAFLTGDNVIGQYDLQAQSGKQNFSVNDVASFAFDPTGTVTVTRLDNNTVLDSFQYNDGQWNLVEHIIDFDHDTAWVIINGVNVQVGWQYSLGRPDAKYHQLDGVNWYTLLGANYNSDCNIDDFCVSTYTCPTPDSLQLLSKGCTHAIINWKQGVEGNTTLVEYDTTGFTPGNGTVMQTFNDQDTLAGLSPGGSYDVYVSEVCGRDTTTLGPLTINLISHASADFSFTLANANPNNRKVTFDGSASVGADSLYWDFGDSTSGNGVSPFHFYNANGTYTVTLIVTSSDCGSDTITKTVTITGIGLVENTLDNSLDLYPNPATDQLSIDFNGAGSSHASIRILDMSGKLLYQKEADDVNGKYHTTVDLSRWASGVYMVEITSGGMKAHRRITKR